MMTMASASITTTAATVFSVMGVTILGLLRRCWVLLRWKANWLAYNHAWGRLLVRIHLSLRRRVVRHFSAYILFSDFSFKFI